MTMRWGQPFFLGSEQQVFALHYPGIDPNAEALVICPPAPQEMMRAHATLVQLTRRLQDAGLSVLRFDYQGTGDSSGSSDSLSLDQWRQDLLAICNYARHKIGCSRLSLLGLRLGAALAIQASQELPVDRLVLWDPILDGIRYLKDMEGAHERMFALNVVEPPFAAPHYGKDQCWGFPWTEGWRSELASLSPALLIPKARRCDIVLSASDSLVLEASQSWQKQGLELQVAQVGEPLYWGDERYLKIRAFAVAQLRHIQGLWETERDD